MRWRRGEPQSDSTAFHFIPIQTLTYSSIIHKLCLKSPFKLWFSDAFCALIQFAVGKSNHFFCEERGSHSDRSTYNFNRLSIWIHNRRSYCVSSYCVEPNAERHVCFVADSVRMEEQQTVWLWSGTHGPAYNLPFQHKHMDHSSLH